MDLRFYIDPQTGQPHIYNHSVTETDVEDVFARPLEDRPSPQGARVRIGQTEGGRYLRVIYIRDDPRSSVFIITAYALAPSDVWALRRRLRRRN